MQRTSWRGERPAQGDVLDRQEGRHGHRGRSRPGHERIDELRRDMRDEVVAIRDEAVAERVRKRGDRRPRVNLDVDQIVDAAMAIADREGPAAVTMRKIAAELGVGVMSLYWYVPTKRDLEALLLTVVVEQVAELLGIDPEQVDPRYEGEA